MKGKFPRIRMNRRELRAFEKEFQRKLLSGELLKSINYSFTTDKYKIN